MCSEFRNYEQTIKNILQIFRNFFEKLQFQLRLIGVLDLVIMCTQSENFYGLSVNI
jgi:hypothetical protein